MPNAPIILAAQEPDGYLQTRFTLGTARDRGPVQHWSPATRTEHEGYVAGYFIEAVDPDEHGYGRMTVSMLDSSRPLPLLRYQTGDVIRLLDVDWVIDMAGRHDEATKIFEKLCARANDVGLLSEEIEVESGAFAGNFPQALTHIGLINAAICLSEEGRTRRGLRRKERAQVP